MFNSIRRNTRRVVVRPLSAAQRIDAQAAFTEWRKNFSTANTKFSKLYKKLEKLQYPSSRTAPLLDFAIFFGTMVSEVEKQEKTWKASAAWRNLGNSMLPMWPLSPVKGYTAEHSSPYTRKGMKTALHPTILKVANNAGLSIENLEKNTNKMKRLRELQKASRWSIKPHEKITALASRRKINYLPTIEERVFNAPVPSEAARQWSIKPHEKIMALASRRKINYLPTIREQSRRQNTKNARTAGAAAVRRMVGPRGTPADVITIVQLISSNYPNQQFFGKLSEAKKLLRKMERSNNAKRAQNARNALNYVERIQRQFTTAWESSRKKSAGSNSNSVHNSVSSQL
ncbi:hypothetical protein EBT25_08470 [bacterium]|jgi:hypothetical protein|nr:hypothetical protein [bacterium]